MNINKSYVLKALVCAAIAVMFALPIPQLDFAWKLAAGVFLTVFSLSIYVQSNANKWQESTSITETELGAMQNHERAAQMLWSIATKGLIESERRTRFQVGSLFVLIIFMILLSFGLIVGGFWLALSSKDQLEIGKISAISGTVVAFLSGSALVVYKRLMDQSSMHAQMLERLNVIAYARDLVGGIKDPATKDQAKASLSVQMLKVRIEPNSKTTQKSGTKKVDKNSHSSQED